MEAKKAGGVKAWLDLATKTPLPILKASAKLLTKQIKEGASLAHMAETIERDPALCLHLFIAANKLNKNDEVEILALGHVISILGMQGVISTVKNAPQMQLHKSDAFQKAYLQSQADSHLAGVLVEHWAGVTHVGNPEQLKWATIIAGAPQWILWRIAYGPMRTCQWMIEREGLRKDKAEQHLFDCTLDELSRLIGGRLQLPGLAQKVLERKQRPTTQQWGKMLSAKHLDHFDNDKNLKRQKSNPLTLMSLMMYLSVQVNLGWMRHHSLRSQKILSHLSHQPLDNVVNKNHQLAVNVSRATMAPQILPVAASLLWPQTDKHEQPWLREPMPCIMSAMEREPESPQYVETKKVAPSKASVKIPASPEQAIQNKPANKPPPRRANKDLLLGLIDQFNKQVAQFKDIHEILLTCNKAINEGLGMRRTFICVLNKTGEVLRPLYCVGIEDNSPIRGLKIEINKNRFFAKLLSQPASMKVDKDNYAQAKNMLNPEVVLTLSNKNFMAMSLFANGKPIGVVYADASEHEDSISDKEYQAFKKICQSAGGALDGYAQKRRAG